MMWFSISILLIYVLFLWWLSRVIQPDDEIHGSNTAEGVSVVIPFRNEESILPTLFESISSLDNLQLVEFILVNDHSDDNSLSKVEQLIARTAGMDISVLALPTHLQGKKEAVNYGVHSAKYEYIVQTDADCVFESSWIGQIQRFLNIHKPTFLILPVFLNPKKTLVTTFDSMDFSALQAISISMAKLGFPIMCSAANMAYSKSFFLSASRQDLEHSSGDDIFLLQAAIKSNKPIMCYSNASVLVRTDANESWKSLINQRHRWGSKNSKVRDLIYQLVLALMLLVNLIVLYHLMTDQNGWMFFGLKLIADYLLLSTFYRHLELRFSKVQFVVNAIIYPFYVVIILLSGILFNSRWKGREVHN